MIRVVASTAGTHAADNPTTGEAACNQAGDEPANRQAKGGDGDGVDLQNLLITLHCAKIAGVPTATDLIAKTLVPQLIRRLKHHWPRHGVEAVMTAAHDAVLWYLARPSRYDGTSARLDVFLSHVAHRRLQDSARQERRRAAHELRLNPAQWATAIASQEQAAIRHDSQVDHAAIRVRLDGLARTDVERRFLQTYLETGEWPNCTTNVGIAEQSRAIHRMTMRLRQRALRSRAPQSRRNVSNGPSKNE